MIEEWIRHNDTCTIPRDKLIVLIEWLAMVGEDTEESEITPKFLLRAILK